MKSINRPKQKLVLTKFLFQEMSFDETLTIPNNSKVPVKEDKIESSVPDAPVAPPPPPSAPPPPPPSAPIPPPAPAPGSGSGNPTAARTALLGSINNFKKSGLKKAVTVDKSKPKI